MTSTTTEAMTVSEPQSARTHQITVGCFLIGGALWIAAAAVGGDDGSTRFQVAETLWLLSHLALTTATLGLWRADLHHRGPVSSIGFGLAVIGRVVFAIAEVIALATGETQDVMLPIAAMLTAVGMLVIGVSIVRTRRWLGTTRFAPLALGVYPFLAMFPLAASDADGPPQASLAGWGLVTLVVGFGLRNQPLAGHDLDKRGIQRSEQP